MRIDLTREEYDECVTEYVDVFKRSNGGVFAEAILRAALRKIGMDIDEIDYLVRLNRP